MKLKLQNVEKSYRYCSGDIVKLPCGHCVACMSNKVNAWSFRIMAELKYYEKVSFITLTYDDEHLSCNGSCSTEDVQKFWKRVRKYYKGKKIFYFGCSEYGSEKGRPHYHFIVGGLDIDDFLCPKLTVTGKRNKNGESPFWKNGIIGFGTEVSTYNIALVRYVTKYVLKTDVRKLNEFCDIMEIERPKIFMSKGIGSRFMEQYHDSEQLPSINKLKYIPSPYWKKKLEIGVSYSPQMINSMKYNNKKRALRSTQLDVDSKEYKEYITNWFNKKEKL